MQVALSHVFEHLKHEGDATRASAASKEASLSAESDAALSLQTQCQASAGRALNTGLLKGAVAHTYAGMRAAQRAATLQRDASLQSTALHAANTGSDRAGVLITATGVLSGVLGETKGVLHRHMAASAVSKICGHVGSATQLRVDAAGDMLSGLSHAEEGEQVAHTIDECQVSCPLVFWTHTHTRTHKDKHA